MIFFSALDGTPDKMSGGRTGYKPMFRSSQAAIAISLSILIKATSIVITAPLLYLAVAEGGELGSAQARYIRSGRGQRPRLQLAMFAGAFNRPVCSLA
jgi:hypothetical protein